MTFVTSGSAISQKWRDTANRYSDSEDADSQPEDAGVSELTGSVEDLLDCTLPPKQTSLPNGFSKGAHRFPVLEADKEDEIQPMLSECSCEASTSSSIDSSSSHSINSAVISPATPNPNISWPRLSPRVVQITEPEHILRPSLRPSPTRITDPMRRWSAMSVTSTGTIVPAVDATNCDCTSLAWAALRSPASVRRKERREKHSDDSYRKISASKTGNSSTDSGLGSSSGSEDSHSGVSNLTAKPPIARKRRRRSLSVLFGSMMRLMFDPASVRKASKSVVHLGVNGLAQNDLGGFSPKWRGDDANEASPLSRLSQENVAKLATYPDTKPTFTAVDSKPFSPQKPEISSTTPAKREPLTDSFRAANLNDSSNSSSLYSPNRTLDFSFKSPSSPKKEAPTLLPTPKPSKPDIQKPSFAGRFSNTPRFHYPGGQPVPQPKNDAIRETVRQLFHAQPQQLLEYKDMEKLCVAIDMAVYAKRPIYEACIRLSGQKLIPESTPALTFSQFQTYWQLMTLENHDEASRFIYTLAAAATGERKPRNYLLKSDFMSMLMDVIHTYPGLNFLVNSTQFHSRYCEVVIVRIFWNVNRSWSGRISGFELRRSDFLRTLRMLETISDINKITDYFSYEHFYVVYCKFWELDQDHDMVISREDMRNHCSGAIPDVVIDRVFSGAVVRTATECRSYKGRGPCRDQPLETIGFEDFVAFLLAEEDKKHPTSQEYWFRILDLDGDGVLSLYEMEYFYREIERKLTQHNFDTLSFKDVACNLFDSIAPSTKGCVTLKELKQCGLAHRFFNTFVNYLKYLEQESSEGERASVKTSGDKELSDWDQYCAMEYEILMSENDESYADENIDVVLDDEEVEEDRPDHIEP